MIEAIRDFWPFYLKEHSHPGNRAMHYAGTILGLSLLGNGLIRGDWRRIALAPVVGYAFPWIGHLFIERNNPATFRSPPKAFVCDLRMLLLALAGRLDEEFHRQGLEGNGEARVLRKRATR